MVVGLQNFRERFGRFDDQFVIIGGTACELLMSEEELDFRATKDIDVVLIVENLTKEFGTQFWEYIKEANYQHNNKSTGDLQFYRFSHPKNNSYPFMLELFSRNPVHIELTEDAILTPLPIDDQISSLSAILLDEQYYLLLKDGRKIVGGVPVLSVDCLIPFKAKAWLDLKSRKQNGEQIDSKNIKKHKNDIFRLAQLLKESESKILSKEVADDLSKFITEMQNEITDLKSIGIKGITKEDMLAFLRNYYSI
ncbi:hypothetical protein ACTQZM_06870 [Enterococcus cecorum]|uniref:hypothetical protein n=1 Tax=Enterococcus cecorum TaxID=44008 RepID=UPI003F90D6B6